MEGPGSRPKGCRPVQSRTFFVFFHLFFSTGIVLETWIRFFFLPNLHNENVLLLSLGQKKAALSKTSC